MQVHGDYAGYAEAALEADASRRRGPVPDRVAAGIRTQAREGRSSRPGGMGWRWRAPWGQCWPGAMTELERPAPGRGLGGGGAVCWADGSGVVREAPGRSRTGTGRRTLDGCWSSSRRENRSRRSILTPCKPSRLGDQLTILTMAGEVVVDYALRFDRELGGAGPLWVVAYANDVFGYVPSLRVLKEGGYEGGDSFYYSTYPTPFAEDVEEMIAVRPRKLVEQVRAGVAAKRGHLDIRAIVGV